MSGVTMTKPFCCLCNTSKDDICNLGELLKTGTIYAHYYCVLLSANIKQEGADDEGIFGFLENDIKTEVKRGRRNKCYKCKKYGSTLKCFSRYCRRYFHLPCAIETNSRIDFSNFATYCKYHNLKNLHLLRRYIKSKEHEICTICQEDVCEPTNALLNKCCGKLLHVTCAKNYALNSGYLTKCPMCNSQDMFIKHLEEMGIFVPCRDASWELEDNAFEELLFVYNRCDVEECCCPNGREHDGRRGWQLERCKYCGSSAVHRRCAAVRCTYICKTCDDKKLQ